MKDVLLVSSAVDVCSTFIKGKIVMTHSDDSQW